MKVALRRNKLHFSDLLCVFIYAFMSHMCMLQVIQILPSLTNGP